MCWKKHDPIIMNPAFRRALSYTINDYPGSVNDLNGCLNDGKQVKETLLNSWPDFDTRRSNDSQAKVSVHKNEVSAAIKVLSPGAIVTILSDSCFSSTNTRLFEPMNPLKEFHPTRNRFYPQPGIKVIPKLKTGTFAGRGEIKWIAMSGCGETEYSADAWINNEYHGAFTWYAMRTLKPGITYRQWHKEICKYLPGTQFEQSPTIEGPDWMLDTMVFSTESLLIHNSTHGTQLSGNGGDEPIDEAICFYDGNLRDDDYNLLLQNIK